MTSKNAKCLLSTEGDVRIDLKCYCNYNSMLTYRLDKQSALISVSNVQGKDGRYQAAVGHIDQISQNDIDAVKRSLDVEWKTALAHIGANSQDQF